MGPSSKSLDQAMSTIQGNVEDCKQSINASFDWIIPDFVTWSKSSVKGEMQRGPNFYFEKNVTFSLDLKFDSEVNSVDSSGCGKGDDGDENFPLRVSVDLFVWRPFYKLIDIKQYSIGLVDHTGKKETKDFVRRKTSFDPNPEYEENSVNVFYDAEFSSQQISDFLSDDGQLRIRCRIETKEQDYDNEPSLVENLAKNWDTGDFSDAILVRFIIE